MCYREVQCTRYACGHEVPHSDRRVDCGSGHCRYSSSHATPCSNCASACKQWLRPAQMQVTRTERTHCYHCTTAPAM
ncbi:hypothetical protein AMATHDRAFT_137447 [Amanita thiersii Skay4041]|uniref:Uncharacterized protein n=1 Tax=Amanita thiersii Skay4041 TaxID=703135 RepID=A0A2A9NVU0_9AGAR|nr:hypothetical protein AMATHDRAFT_137447 [Amanita thiersii Skay4041]